MGLFGFLKNLFSAQQTKDHSEAKESANSPKKLTYSEKELLAVQRTTQSDIAQLTKFPYLWNRPIEKLIQQNTHPFVYMDIVGPNIAIAKKELEKMNQNIEQSKKLCSALPKSLCIPVGDIVFRRSIKNGYTRLICSPITHTGAQTSSPISLLFMTDLTRDTNTTHGELHYNRNGKVSKADIFFWRAGLGGFFLYYEDVDGTLSLSRIEAPNSKSGERSVIYKGPHILAREERLAKEEKDFAWLQSNIPDKCPKAIAGYRKMKTQNSKNYQELQKLAAEKGRKI